MAKSNRKSPAAASVVAAAPSELLVLNMTTEVATQEDTAMSELLAMLTDPTGVSSDEVIETTTPSDTDVEIAALISAAPEITPVEPAAPLVVSDEDIASALAGAESVEAMIHAATPQLADGSVTGDASDVVTAATMPDATDAAAEVEAKPKKVAVPRKHYSNKADRIIDRLGDALPEFTVLTLDDATEALDEEGVKAKMDETMALIRGFSQKKQNRAGFLMEFVSGKKATLNAVMERAVRLLAKDGFLTTGKDGNYLTDLLTTYTPAAARAMGSNTVAVLHDLKLISEDGKGRYLANDESLLLAKVNELLAIPGA